MKSVVIAIVTSTILAFSIVPPAVAQSNGIWTAGRCSQLSQLLREMNEAKEFSGTVLIAENGQPVFNESYGFSNITAGTKFDDEASFRLASVSKQFTAMAIMILQERCKLDYDDSITKFLTTLPYQEVTIRHLLNHTSGLPDYMVLMNRHWDRGQQLSERRIAFNKDAVATFAEHKPELLFPPGTKFQYSNTGYVFLGHIIENVAEQPVADFMVQNIFDPLDMRDSAVFSPSDKFNLEHRVYGFRWQQREPGYRENDFHYLNGMIGDGGMYVSGLDMVKWDSALYGEQIVKQSTLSEAFQPARLQNGDSSNYGFGWAVDKQDGEKIVVSHGGGWVGFRTYIARNITDRRMLVILTNNSCNQLDRIRKRVSEIARSRSDEGE